LKIFSCEFDFYLVFIPFSALVLMSRSKKLLLSILQHLMTGGKVRARGGRHSSLGEDDHHSDNFREKVFVFLDSLVSSVVLKIFCFSMSSKLTDTAKVLCVVLVLNNKVLCDAGAKGTNTR
jgi:hypothetical protein